MYNTINQYLQVYLKMINKIPSKQVERFRILELKTSAVMRNDPTNFRFPNIQFPNPGAVYPS